MSSCVVCVLWAGEGERGRVRGREGEGEMERESLPGPTRAQVFTARCHGFTRGAGTMWPARPHHSNMRVHTLGGMVLSTDTTTHKHRQTLSPRPTHAHRHTHARTHTSTHAHRHAHTLTHTRTQTRTQTHTCTHAHTHTLTHVQSHTQTHTCTYTHTHTHTHTSRRFNTLLPKPM